MQVHCDAASVPDARSFAAPARCPRCGDWMVAPIMSELAGGEIRHHWQCDACGEISTTLIPLGEF